MRRLQTVLRSLLAPLCVAICFPAGAADLLKDINTVFVPESSNPRYLGVAGANVLFVAGTGSASTELGLWASDGTAAGTRLVFGGGATPAFFGAQTIGSLGGRVVWTGASPVDVADIWSSDGTTAGTLKIASVAGNLAGVLGTLPNAVLFLSRTEANAAELWRTNGTAAGTWRVAQFDSPPPDSPLQAAVIGNLMYFSATTTAEGREIWVTDGSTNPANTHLVADLEPGPGTSDPFQFTAVGSTLYFTAILGNSGIPQLWRRNSSGSIAQLTTEPTGASIVCASNTLLFYHSIGQPGRSDGTVSGTFRLLPGPPDPFQGIGECITAGNHVYFATETAAGGRRIWISDGTVVGTSQVPLGTIAQAPTPVLWSGTHLVFSAYDPVNGAEMWVTNGTAAGTHIIADLFPGAASGGTGVIGVSGSHLFGISARQYNNYPDDLLSVAWRADTDGTHAVLLTDNVTVEPYTSPFPYSLIANGHLFFASRMPVQGIEPSASDGTVSGTRVLRDIAPQTRNLSSAPFDLVNVGGTTLFSANDGLSGRELWRTDGTSAGTNLLLDAYPGPRASEPQLLGAVDNKAYFIADDGSHGRELWISDGSAGGTRLLADLTPGPDSTDWNCFLAARLGANVYFGVRSGATGYELWRTDGTLTGTQLFADIVPGAGSSGACPLAIVGTRLFFSANTDGKGRELWITDGTAAGAHQVADLTPSAGTEPEMAVAFQGGIAFAGNLRFAPFNLPIRVWWTDGGTPRLVLDVASGGNIAWIRPLGNSVYIAVLGGSAPGLYRWDGGNSVPQRFVADVRPTGRDRPVEFRGRLFFAAVTDSEGGEIFATDGTLAGTSAVTNVSNPGESNVFVAPTVLGQDLYFTVSSADGATQLARSDGTGTTVLTRFTGYQRGWISGPVVAGGQVIFGAEDEAGQIGAELYAQSNVAPRVTNDVAVVTSGDSATVNLLTNDADPDGRLTASGIRIVAQPTKGTVSVDVAGVATYRANAGTSGTDTFQYAVTDNVGYESAVATVTVTINAPVAPPSAPPSTPSASSGGGGSFGALMLLGLGAILASRFIPPSRRSRRMGAPCSPTRHAGSVRRRS